MNISTNLIDLLKTQEEFAARFGNAQVSKRRFGLPIVSMAHSVLGRHGVPIADLPGIRKCLVHSTGTVSWRNHLWFIPLPSKSNPFPRGLFGGHWQSEELFTLVDSLIVTMLTYQDVLWEFETDLAPIVMMDIVSGFERVCDWVERGVSLDHQKNEVITPITNAVIVDRVSFALASKTEGEA